MTTSGLLIIKPDVGTGSNHTYITVFTKGRMGSTPSWFLLSIELAGVWPLLKLLDYAAGEADEYLAKFGMTISRGHAWNVAKELSDLEPQERIAKIEALDREVLKISKIILNPGYRVRAVLLLIRLGEIRSVPRIIEMLE